MTSEDAGVQVEAQEQQTEQSRGKQPAITATAQVVSPQPVQTGIEPSPTFNELGFSRGFAAKYELGEPVGKGATSTVHICTDKATGERFAAKVIPKVFDRTGGELLDRDFVARVYNEVDISRKLGKSLNVCYYYGAYETDTDVRLVIELCTGGQLWDRVRQDRYSEKQAARLVKEVLRTVAVCHSKGVLMRDIKPHNFIFASEEEGAPLKAIDFGISVRCKQGQYLKERAGSRIVMAPEVVRQRYTLSADLWSVGIMAYVLLTGRLPYPFWQKLYVRGEPVTGKEMDLEILRAPLDFESAPWDAVSGEAKAFVQSLLQRDPDLRPTAEEALAHSWLHGLKSKEDVPLGRSIVQRLQRFGTYGRLKQLALRAIASHLPRDSCLVEDLRGLFLELDPSDTGHVHFVRLQQEMEGGHFNLSPREKQQLLALVEQDGSGNITFHDFVTALMDWGQVQASGEWDLLVERAFEALDVDCSGHIGPEDLEALLCGDYGCEQSWDEVPDSMNAVLREADLDRDGKIDLGDFRQLLAAELGRLELFETRLAY
ncbi:hypothetical protein N2152v2_010781 [Parachlorella kessleri]